MPAQDSTGHSRKSVVSAQSIPKADAAAEAEHPAGASAHPSARREALEDLFRYLQDVVAAVAAEFEADAASVWLRDWPPGVVSCVYYDPGRLPRNRTPALTKREYRPEEIPSWRSLTEFDRPTVFRDCPRNPLLRHASEWFADNFVETTLAIPIRDSKETAAWLLLFHRGNSPYHPADLERASIRGRQLSLAVRVARAAAGERQSAIVAERERIARELHDTFAQCFTSILLQIEAAKALLGEDEKATLIPLDRASDLARESLAEARRAVLAMHPRALREGGLAAALERLVKEMTSGSGVKAKFAVRGPLRALPIGMETELLRAIQEAITNALRHARPTAIRVTLTFEDSFVKASVEDDGCGFSPDDAGNRKGFGLTSMRERVEGLSGRFQVSSHPARGTRVLIRIPLSDA